MHENDFTTINRLELTRRMVEEHPDNADPRHGYALVNVLKPESFEKERIPASINIPLGNESDVEKRYSKSKDIVVYCASKDCDASPKAAKRLTAMGFTRIFDYEAGMRDWKESGGAIESGPSTGNW